MISVVFTFLFLPIIFIKLKSLLIKDLKHPIRKLGLIKTIQPDLRLSIVLFYSLLSKSIYKSPMQKLGFINGQFLILESLNLPSITSCQTIINLFKDLKNRKLTIFDLKINKIVDITNEKIDQLEREYTQFLKSQSNLQEFRFKLNTPVNLEAFEYFPQFIKIKFQMIKNLKRFDVSIPGKQLQNLIYCKVQKGNESVLGELTSNTNKIFILFGIKNFVSDGYIDKYTIKIGDISKFQFEFNKISPYILINILKDLRNRNLSVFDLKINGITKFANEKLPILNKEFTEFLKSQSRLSQFRLILKNNGNIKIGLKVFSYLPEFIKNKSRMIKNMKDFEVFIGIAKNEEEKKCLTQLRTETNKALSLDSNIQTSFKIVEINEEVLQQLYYDSDISDSEFEHFSKKVEQNPGKTIKVKRKFNKQVFSKGNMKFFSFNCLSNSFKINKVSTFIDNADQVSMGLVINLFKDLSQRQLSFFDLGINGISQDNTWVSWFSGENENILKSSFSQFLKSQSDLSDFRFVFKNNGNDSVGINTFNYFPQFIHNKIKMISNMKRFHVSIQIENKDDINILNQLTFKTNKELLKTNKFVSDGYIDTYTIKSGNPLEFKYEINIITLNSLLNTFKELKKRKLTLFKLKIENITNVTNDIINEFKDMFLQFLQSQSNIQEFSFVFKNYGYDKTGLSFNKFPQSLQEQSQIVETLVNLILVQQSQILKVNEIPLIKQWLGKNQIILKCIYKASVDGDKANNFWEKVNGVSNTVTFIQSSQGKRFGGFRKLAFDKTKDGYAEDKEAFLFQLDYKEKCFLIQGKEHEAVDNRSNYLSQFGDVDIMIEDGCLNRKDNCSYLGNTYKPKNYHGIDPYQFLAGSEYFQVDELEVFQVIH